MESWYFTIYYLCFALYVPWTLKRAEKLFFPYNRVLFSYVLSTTAYVRSWCKGKNEDELIEWFNNFWYVVSCFILKASSSLCAFLLTFDCFALTRPICVWLSCPSLFGLFVLAFLYLVCLSISGPLPWIYLTVSELISLFFPWPSPALFASWVCIWPINQTISVCRCVSIWAQNLSPVFLAQVWQFFWADWL